MSASQKSRKDMNAAERWIADHKKELRAAGYIFSPKHQPSSLLKKAGIIKKKSRPFGPGDKRKSEKKESGNKRARKAPHKG